MSRITNEQAADLLCNAFEGGSGYWAAIENFVEPETVAMPWGEDEYHPRYISYPFSKGGAVVLTDIEDDDEPKFVLDHKAVIQGKKLMENSKYSHHLADVLSDNADATTGDVFLQLCLFGEVVYG
jgi:hypothetical protein